MADKVNKNVDSSFSDSGAESSDMEMTPIPPKSTSKNATKAIKKVEYQSDSEPEGKPQKDQVAPAPQSAPASKRTGISRTKTGVNLVPYQEPGLVDPFASEARLFYGLLIAFEAAIIIIYAVWADYKTDAAEVAEDIRIYGYTRDINIMIFFGFGFLMTFLRRYAYSAVGYTFLVSAMVAQWSMFLQALVDYEHNDGKFHIGIYEIVNGLFCSGAVMISYGAILGKVTPVQMLLLAIMEPIFYWVNIYININQLKAIDVGGGMVIHTFGAYFGIAVTWFLTSFETRSHKDNVNSYSSDIFSLAGTLFLWIMWPSFNAVVAPQGLPEYRALVNTFLSITASVLSSFLVSRMLTERKFDIVHIQNSTLAGGVAMGVAAHLNLHPSGVIGIGFLAGVISVWGYKFLTPLLSKKFNLQDVCGVNNLHGMPGILGCLVGIFGALHAYRNKWLYPDGSYADLFPKGDEQAAYQTATLFITLGIAVVGGCFTGVMMMISHKQSPINKRDFFNDRTFWHLPTDYEFNIYDKSEKEVEMKDHA